MSLARSTETQGTESCFHYTYHTRLGNRGTGATTTEFIVIISDSHSFGTSIKTGTLVGEYHFTASSVADTTSQVAAYKVQQQPAPQTSFFFSKNNPTQVMFHPELKVLKKN